jgi:hypothetical protein
MCAAGASAGDDDGGGVGPASNAKDRVAGTGAFFQVNGRVHVNAKSGASGENPRGRFRVAAFGTIDVRGEVTCLNVQGNGAFISGVIQKGRPDDFRTRGVRIEIRDNHEAGTKRVPDEFNFDAGIIQDPLTVCPPPGAFALFPVDRGNFVVHDGTPAPPGGGGDDDGDDDGDDGDDDDDAHWDDLAVQSRQLPTPLAPSDSGSLFLR